MISVAKNTRANMVKRCFSSISRPRCLVYGGNGQLGQQVVAAFNAGNWETICVDVKANPNAHSSFSINANVPLESAVATIKTALTQQQTQLNCVINVAGGWDGGDAADDQIVSKTQKQISINLETALASSHLAAKFLRPGGLLVLTGANPVFQGGTGFMLSYGIAKAGVHHIVKSLSNGQGGLPANAKVIGILPTTIDTHTNRTAMPDADFRTWTSPSTFAKSLLKWAKEANGIDVDQNEARVPPVVDGAFYTFTTTVKKDIIFNQINGIDV